MGLLTNTSSSLYFEQRCDRRVGLSCSASSNAPDFCRRVGRYAVSHTISVHAQDYFCLIVIESTKTTMMFFQVAEVVFLHSINNLLSRLTGPAGPSAALIVSAYALHLGAVAWMWCRPDSDMLITSGLRGWRPANVS